MEEAIKNFGKNYNTKLVRNLENPPKVLDEIVDMVVKAVETPRNTMYVFGNGGSYGIAKHFELSLKRIYEDLSIGNGRPSLRIDTSFDFHEGQQSALKHGFNELFARRLYEQGANDDDLVICISGSGNSDNLVRAIEYSRESGIPTIAFAGNFGGKIGNIADLAYNVEDTDQQLSEDVIQGLLHIVADTVYDKVNGVITGLFKQQAELRHATYNLQRIMSFDAIEAAFLDNVSSAVVDSFYDGRTVYLLGPEGDGLSISSEHTAHNLNWDAVYQVANPPMRNIVSTPTSCDYSGVGNDRLLDGIVSVQQLENSSVGDVLVLFSNDLDNKAVQNTLAKAEENNLETYVIYGNSHSYTNDNYQCIHTKDPFIAADVMQVFGHMLGRIVRTKIQLRNGVDISNPSEYLINNDLAQRRLLHDEHR